MGAKRSTTLAHLSAPATPTLENARQTAIRNLTDQYVPPYTAAFKLVPVISKQSWPIQILFFQGLWLILHLIVTWKTGATEYFVDWWFYLPFFAAIGTFGWWALSYARSRMLEAIDDILNLLTSDEQVHTIEQCLCLLYSSPLQVSTCLALGILGVTLAILAQANIPLGLYLYGLVFLFLALQIAGFGLWVAISSTYLVARLARMSPLRLNPLAPGVTMGLTRLADLLANYASLFALETTLFSSLFLVVSIGIGGPPPVNRAGPTYQLITGIVFLFVIIVVPTYFAVPQILLRRVITQAKHSAIRAIEEMLTRQGTDTRPFFLELLNEGEKYITLINHIRNGPNFAVGFPSAFRFVSSAVVSIGISYVSNPALAQSLGSFITVIFFPG